MSEPGGRSAVQRVFVNGREGRLRAGWRLLVAIVALVIVSILVGLFVAFAQSVLALLIPLSVAGALQSPLSNQLFWNVGVTVALVAVAWRFDVRTLPDLGLGGHNWWPNLAFGLVLGLVMTTVVFAAELAAGLVTVEELFVTQPRLGIDASFPVALALTVLMFVAVGIGEEVLVRGYLMTNVAEGLNGLGPLGPRAAIGTAAVLTSGLFGALHFANPNAGLVSALNISVVGLFFAATYVVTGDLGVPIGVHITWNLTLSSLYGLPVSGIRSPATILEVRQTGDPLITGGAFGPEAGLVVYLSLAVAVALTWWWVRRTEGSVGFPIGVAVPDLRTEPDARPDVEQD